MNSIIHLSESTCLLAVSGNKGLDDDVTSWIKTVEMEKDTYKSGLISRLLEWLDIDIAGHFLLYLTGQIKWRMSLGEASSSSSSSFSISV